MRRIIGFRDGIITILRRSNRFTRRPNRRSRRRRSPFRISIKNSEDEEDRLVSFLLLHECGVPFLYNKRI